MVGKLRSKTLKKLWDRLIIMHLELSDVRRRQRYRTFVKLDSDSHPEQSSQWMGKIYARVWFFDAWQISLAPFANVVSG